MKLTPLKVNMLMHIFIGASTKNFEHPAQAEDALVEFEKLKLITAREINSCGYRLTELGHAYVKLILTTPLPEAKTCFTDPRTGEPV